MRRTTLILTACAALAAACASDRGGHGDYGGDPVAHGAASLNIFISPSGKPYRAGRDAPYPSAAWFSQADADHDGRLTLTEFRADAQAFFQELDTNHDGEIDGFETQNYEQHIAPEILPRIEGLRSGEGLDQSLFNGRGGKPSDSESRRSRRVQAADRVTQGAALYGMLNEPEPVTAADTDFSSRITLPEWLAKASARFALLDTKHNDYLTLDTLPKTAAQLVLERLRRREAERARKAR